MEEGRIVERGTHAELLARDGRYAEMWQLQQSSSEAVAGLIASGWHEGCGGSSPAKPSLFGQTRRSAVNGPP